MAPNKNPNMRADMVAAAIQCLQTKDDIRKHRPLISNIFYSDLVVGAFIFGEIQ